MNTDEILAKQAESELQDLKGRAKAGDYSDEAREALWKRFRGWIAHPVFAQYPGMLRCVVLNELQFALSIEELNNVAWLLIGDLVEKWERQSLGGLMDAIRIASLECIAEPPERPDDLRQLFKLAAHPHTRWAVFAAYQNVPWRLRPHARQYSEGAITDEDCDDWLSENHPWDEILIPKLRATPPKPQDTTTAILSEHVTLAPVTADDFDELAALRIAAMRDSLERVGRFDPERARARLRNSFHPEHSAFIVSDGERIGFFTFRPAGDGFHLDHLYVHPGGQSRGIGSLVLRYLLCQSDARRMPVHLGALRDSPSNRFYQRHDFVRTAEDEWDIYYVRTPRSKDAGDA